MLIYAVNEPTAMLFLVGFFLKPLNSIAMGYLTLSYIPKEKKPVEVYLKVLTFMLTLSIMYTRT